VDTEPFEIKVNAPTVRTGGTAGMRSARRNEFTAEEDRLLLAYVKAQIAANKPVGGNVIYNAFAEAVSSR
jgi:hypothetical protein